MSNTRVLTVLMYGLFAAGAVVLRLAGDPRSLDDPRWYVILGAAALFGAGIGVFLSMLGLSLASACRMRQAERDYEPGIGPNRVPFQPQADPERTLEYRRHP